MNDIISAIQTNIGQLATQIKKLEAQRDALQVALATIGGEGAAKRRRSPSSTHATAAPPARRKAGRRRKRGANQQIVLKALGSSPRRLTEIASEVGLKLTATGGVLRALISKGL